MAHRLIAGHEHDHRMPSTWTVYVAVAPARGVDTVAVHPPHDQPSLGGVPPPPWPDTPRGSSDASRPFGLPADGRRGASNARRARWTSSSRSGRSWHARRQAPSGPAGVARRMPSRSVASWTDMGPAAWSINTSNGPTRRQAALGAGTGRCPGLPSTRRALPAPAVIHLDPVEVVDDVGMGVRPVAFRVRAEPGRRPRVPGAGDRYGYVLEGMTSAAARALGDALGGSRAIPERQPAGTLAPKRG
jgi:hypothetical protein